jgi:anhydro-N-acetylmuramic acid kinase
MTTRREIFAGVMSGTSLDGVDAVIADFAPAAGQFCALLGATHVAFPSSLRDELMALQAAGEDELVRAARAANALADLYAMALIDACTAARVAPHDVVAAGVHGQTVRHRPGEGWTLQINNPARVAERAYMTVVADFRARDIAACGQARRWSPRFTRQFSLCPIAIGSWRTSAGSPISPTFP